METNVKQVTPSHPSGLMNMGNTCFLNTLLQCLLHVDRVREFFINAYRKHTESDNNIHETNKTNILITYEIGLLFNQLWNDKQSLLPRRFITALACSMPSYMNMGEQHDIGELWCWLADRIHQEHKSLESIKWNFNTIGLGNLTMTMKDMDVLKFHKKCLQKWNDFHKNDSIEWTKLHEGLQVIQIICKKCKHVYHNFEPFTMITLDIPDESSNSHTDLSKCFQDLFKVDTLNKSTEDGNLQEWKCDHCKEYCLAERVMRFWSVPDMLVIVLKRFEMVQHGNVYGHIRKNNMAVEIPLEFQFSDGTILTNVTNELGNPIFKLASVGNHYGSTIGGHYNSICNFNGEWWKIDDIHIEKMHHTDAVEKNTGAYVLFYQRA